MRVNYRDTEGNLLAAETLKAADVPARGGREKLPLYGNVTVMDRLIDRAADEITLTCERYDDGDSDGAQ